MQMTVTSPFFKDKSQFFYEASLMQQSHKVLIKLFNHRGILKNKKLLQVPSHIVELYPADRFLVGLDAQHKNLCIVDITSNSHNIAMGQLRQPDLIEQNLKFQFFIADEHSNLLFGLLGGHHIVYLSVKEFHEFSNNSQLKHNIQNKDIIIKKLYYSKEYINKFEVRNSKREKKKIQSPKKPSAIYQSPKRHQKLTNKKEYEQFTQVFYLTQSNRKMTKFEVHWDIQKVNQVIATKNIYDFCFKHGWELTITQIQNKSKNQSNDSPKKQAQKFKLSFTGPQNLQMNVCLSGQHMIFCSKETLLIVDQVTQIIFGYHKSDSIHVQNLASIPKNMNFFNTMLIFQRPSKFSLNFIFQIFNHAKGQFMYQISKTNTLDKKMDTSLKNEIWVRKNIEKIFTLNGFINPYFDQKVKQILNSISERKNGSEKSIPSEKHNSQMKMMKNQQQRENNYWSIQLANKFLHEVVLRDKNPILFNKLVQKLISYDAKALFSQKQISNTKSQISRMIQSENPYRQLSNHKTMNLGCDFDVWNQYFEQIINQAKSNIEKFSSSLYPQSQSSNQKSSSSNSQNIWDTVITDAQASLQNLTYAISFYDQFLSLVENYLQRYQLEIDLKSSLQKHKKIIQINLRKAKSLYLINNIFLTCKHGESSPQIILQSIEELFKELQEKQNKLIGLYKKQLLNSVQELSLQKLRESLEIPFLQLYEFFDRISIMTNKQKNLAPEQIFSYFLLNLETFQETSYFYNKIQKYTIKLIAKSMIDKQKKQLFERKTKNSVSMNPYMGKYMLELFELADEISNSFTSQIKQGNMMISIEKACSLALKLRLPSFLKFMIQVCAYYSNSQSLIKLVQSIRVHPFSTQIGTKQDMYPSKANSIHISKQFEQTQKFILNSILFCIKRDKNTTYSLGLREILLFEFRRIQSINQVIERQLKVYQEQNNSNHQLGYNFFNNRKSVLIEAQKLTSIILSQFYIKIQQAFQNQSARVIKELKDQESLRAQNTIEKIRRLSHSKQPSHNSQQPNFHEQNSI